MMDIVSGQPRVDRLAFLGCRGKHVNELSSKVLEVEPIACQLGSCKESKAGPHAISDVHGLSTGQDSPARSLGRLWYGTCGYHSAANGAEDLAHVRGQTPNAIPSGPICCTAAVALNVKLSAI
jgi:hypothetical protein